MKIHPLPIRAALAACVLAAATGLSGGPAGAGLILESSRPYVSVQTWWTLSASTRLLVTNTDSAPAFLNSGRVALLLVQVSPTVSGTTTMTIGAPSSGAILTDAPVSYDLIGGTTLAVPVTVDGTSYDTFDWGVAANATFNVNDSLAAGATATLARLTFTAADDTASGVWDLYAVNEDAFAYTGWSAFEDVEGTFANVPQADGTAVHLARIAVPEPSAACLIVTAALAGMLRWRRVSRAASP